MVKLFDIAYSENKASPNALYLPTPLGKLNLEVTIDSIKLSKTLPDFSGEISNHSSIHGWCFKDIQIELLKVNVEPLLPPGMYVSHCFAFLWRFKTTSKKIDLKFRCQLSLIGKEELETGPETGEGLIAQSWDSKNVRLTIGTEDEEYLISRAEHQQWLPPRLAKENLIHPEMINCIADGIQVSLPTFLENEEGQVQFIIAWVEGKNRKDISTWFAVDISPEKILTYI